VFLYLEIRTMDEVQKPKGKVVHHAMNTCVIYVNHSGPRHKMEVSGQLHNLVAL
jgi:ribosomal protein L14